ncbi:MAG: hypothetical protein AAGB05_01325 [Pseudomonadota bacterium]
MVLSFVLAAAAGFAVPYVEPFLQRGLAAALKSDLTLGAGEMRIIALLVLLALSALVAGAMGINTVSLATVIGGGLGYFAKPLYAFLRDPDGTDVPEEARWDGRVRDARADDGAASAKSEGGS